MIYAPKGGMCMTCTRKLSDCSALPFKDMPVIARGPITTFVRCREHKPTIVRDPASPKSAEGGV